MPRQGKKKNQIVDAEQHMSSGCVCTVYSTLLKGKEWAIVAALGQGETIPRLRVLSVYKRTNAFQERQSWRPVSVERMTRTKLRWKLWISTHLRITLDINLVFGTISEFLDVKSRWQNARFCRAAALIARGIVTNQQCCSKGWLDG